MKTLGSITLLLLAGYAWASTRPEFWLGNPDQEVDGFGPERGRDLLGRLEEAPRRFVWINVMGGPDFLDGGLRDAQDYRRLMHSIDQYVKARTHSIFQLNTEGEVCQWCPFNDDCPEEITQ